jgi:hypothetical protein
MVVRRTASGADAAVGCGDAGGRAGETRAIVRLVRSLILGITLAGCTIPFGNGGDSASSGQTPEETRRERNRLYQQEQERYQREMQFDRVGPPSDR